MKKLTIKDIKVNSSWTNYSIMEAVEEFDLKIDLDDQEKKFLDSVYIAMDEEKVIIDIRSVLNDDIGKNYPLVNKILTETLPNKIKEPLVEIFDMDEIEDVQVYLGFDFCLEDNDGQKYAYYSLDTDPDELEIISNSGDGDDYAPKGMLLRDLENIPEKMEHFKGLITEGREAFTQTYNYVDRYSDIEKGIIGIDVKTNGGNYPDMDEVQQALLKKGYTKESVENLITDEYMGMRYSWFLEDMEKTFNQVPTTDIEYLGLQGRSGGTAQFKLDSLGSVMLEDYEEMTLRNFEAEDVDVTSNTVLDTISLGAFETWVKGLHEAALKGESLETVVEAIEGTGQLSKGIMSTLDNGDEDVAERPKI